MGPPSARPKITWAHLPTSITPTGARRSAAASAESTKQRTEKFRRSLPACSSLKTVLAVHDSRTVGDAGELSRELFVVPDCSAVICHFGGEIALPAV